MGGEREWEYYWCYLLVKRGWLRKICKKRSKSKWNVENLLFCDFAHVLLLLPCTTKGLELNKTP